MLATPTATLIMTPVFLDNRDHQESSFPCPWFLSKPSIRLDMASWFCRLAFRFSFNLMRSFLADTLFGNRRVTLFKHPTASSTWNFSVSTLDLRYKAFSLFGLKLIWNSFCKSEFSSSTYGTTIYQTKKMERRKGQVERKKKRKKKKKKRKKKEK